MHTVQSTHTFAEVNNQEKRAGGSRPRHVAGDDVIVVLVISLADATQELMYAVIYVVASWGRLEERAVPRLQMQTGVVASWRRAGCFADTALFRAGMHSC